MAQYIDKDALIAEIERRKEKCDTFYDIALSNNAELAKVVIEEQKRQHNSLLSFLDTLEVKEVDLELITGWFDHVAQMADDRKTLNGEVMEDWAALDEIKCLAKNSSEFITKHYKAQKGE